MARRHPRVIHILGEFRIQEGRAAAFEVLTERERRLGHFEEIA